MNSIFAVTTRGLEPVCEKEMRQIPGLTIQQMGYRRISANLPELSNSLLDLRTIDDIFLNLGTWRGLVSQRSGLTDIRLHSTQLDLISAITAISQIRTVPKRPSFSITASFVGKRNYSTEEIKQNVMLGLTSHYAWTYLEDESNSDINLRVFIEHDTAYIGLRLGKQSLQKRFYKQIHVPGSLKPPVAAALLWLGRKKEGLVVDPFCGAGTILIEAGLMGLEALGGDIDTIALKAAQENMDLSRVKPRIAMWDARKLPLDSQSAGLVVSNFPWGKQVTADANLELLYRQACQEIKRILPPGNQAVILTSLPEWIPSEVLHIVNKIEISLFGQNPSILIASN